MRKLYSLIAAAVLLGALAVLPATASANVCSHDIFYTSDGWTGRFVSHGNRGMSHIHTVWMNRTNQPGSAGFYAYFVCDNA